MTEKTSFSYKLTPEQEKTLIEVIRTGNYRPVKVEYTKIAADIDHCRICLYKSGKCLVQGKKAEEFVTFVLEPVVLAKVSLGYETILNPEIIQPHMGIDESGKGDFFGPLVTASAYIDASLFQTMKDMDVKDSKKITSDKKALALGSDLRKLLGKRFSIVKIGPEAYNRLYSKFRNVNSLLAWAHARAIENLLVNIPDCPRAISDQFGQKHLIERALMRNGKKIELVQRHKAESDLAVAAASIIAREEFLRSLKKMGMDYGTTIPKGASDAVKKAAVQIVRSRGPQILTTIAKCHFKTTDAVLAEAGSNRSALGPAGQAVSRPITGNPWHKHKRPDADKPTA